jgi:adenylate kinase
MKIIPDKVMNINIKKYACIARIKNNIQNQNPDLSYGDGELADEISLRMYQDFMMHQQGVLDTLGSFVYQFDASEKTINDTGNDLTRMLRVRFRNNAPRRPPKVILIGPPGAGKTTQARLVEEAFGLICVSPQHLLKEEAERNPPIKVKITEAAEKGEPVPDEILLRLVDARIRQSDCRMNGWVLDGFPETESQVNLLKSMRVKPNLVCMFEQNVEESVRKLHNRRIDPMTGERFNVEVNPPKTNAQADRLIGLKEDEEECVKKRFEFWTENISKLEENYKHCLLSVSSDRLVE